MDRFLGDNAPTPPRLIAEYAGMSAYEDWQGVSIHRSGLGFRFPIISFGSDYADPSKLRDLHAVMSAVSAGLALGEQRGRLLLGGEIKELLGIR